MISGNPYKFAVLSGVINEWNLDDTFGNGVLLICINGDRSEERRVGKECL